MRSKSKRNTILTAVIFKKDELSIVQFKENFTIIHFYKTMTGKHVQPGRVG